MQLECVHRGHRETGAVNDTTDVAVELDVGADVGLFSLDLGGILLGAVPPFLVAAVSEGGVVVESNFAVDSDHRTVGGEYERIDLHERRVHVSEDLVEVGEHVAGWANRRGGKPKLSGERTATEGREALNGVDWHAEHGARVGSIDLFN